jgi:hypothetical protein
MPSKKSNTAPQMMKIQAQSIACREVVSRGLPQRTALKVQYIAAHPLKRFKHVMPLGIFRSFILN